MSWYIYTQLYHHIIGYNKWIRIVLLLFCLFVSFSHALTSSSFFWISLQNSWFFWRRGGKGYDKSMMAAAQENKTNPFLLLRLLLSSYPSFFISLSWFGHRITCRFSALWITFIVNFEVINLTFSFVNLEKLVTVPLVDSVIFWIWWMINWQEARFGRDGSNKSIRKKGIFCYKFHLKWLLCYEYSYLLLAGIFWWSLSVIAFSQIWW